MIFNIITPFTEIFTSFLNTSLIKKAITKNLIEFNLIDLKEYGVGKYKKIDDTVYGGGAGMVIRVDVVERALEKLNNSYKITLSPKGNNFSQTKAIELSTKKEITFICGRYEGFDERVYSLADENISIGNYVTMGGEVPTMVIIEAVSRLIPNVIGNSESIEEESHNKNIIHEYPNYTKPEVYNGESVPKVLLSGNHELIKKWRKENTKLIN